MSVLIGSARINEKGSTNGGAAGDQTGGEVSTQAWYLHSKGWIVIRAKDPAVREMISRNMQAICDNDNIGYCQAHRGTLTTAAKPYGYDASKVAKKVEVDCSEAVRNCALYAGISVGSFNTASEVSVLRATGKFDILKDNLHCKSSDYLLRGDILVTKTKGHTVVVLSDGAKVAEASVSASGSAEITTTSLKVSSTIKAIQTWLNAYYKAGLTVDGAYGLKTKAALVKAWQTEVGGLTVDGIFGAKSKAAATSHNIQKKSIGILVTIWQALLVCKGYNPNGIDGEFGGGCHAATLSFQKTNRLRQDGIVGSNTWYAAFH